jgi:8-oxo-dGTP pyrophosphatase MutT (NUDIX family)
MKGLIRKRLKKLLMEGTKKRVAAGVLVKCTSTNKVLLLLRNDFGDEPNTWALVSGGVDKGEDILEGLKREVSEEMQIDPNIISYKFIEHINVDEKNMDFYYYEGFTKSEFIPTLDHENLDWGWFDINELPSPLYPNIKSKIDKILI